MAANVTLFMADLYTQHEAQVIILDLMAQTCISLCIILEGLRLQRLHEFGIIPNSQCKVFCGQFFSNFFRA
ncbi:hypothetical protein GDO81_021819 [Engystomops pustulosus]|uniref:Uncharacterized protein n=1 Tax=Engystomops pustulosus TaxID=76066 RepID=A0AAV6Z5Q0_ENGPU|nr:hypothetical protein GDO81_021819 [Engystomops pustulosus]